MSLTGSTTCFVATLSKFNINRLHQSNTPNQRVNSKLSFGKIGEVLQLMIQHLQLSKKVQVPPIYSALDKYIACHVHYFTNHLCAVLDSLAQICCFFFFFRALKWLLALLLCNGSL